VVGSSQLASGMAAILYTQAAFTGNNTPILRSLTPSTLTQQTLSKLTAGCATVKRNSQFCNTSCGAPAAAAGTAD
jgi:hypothetical protein